MPGVSIHGVDVSRGVVAAGMQVAWLNREGHAWNHGDTRPHLEVPDLHALCACWPDYKP